MLGRREGPTAVLLERVGAARHGGSSAMAASVGKVSQRETSLSGNRRAGPQRVSKQAATGALALYDQATMGIGKGGASKRLAKTASPDGG
jgi:hypothetical protein